MKLRLWLIGLLLCTLHLFGFAHQGSGKTVHPGDKVKIVCAEEPSLNKTYDITKDGLVILPFVGAIEIAGKTEESAAAEIAGQLVDQRILRKATVQLQLIAIQKPVVSISGAVKKPLEFPYADGLRLSDVMRIAEPTEDADLDSIEIKGAGGQQMSIHFINDPNASLEANPYLRVGDVITVGVSIKPKEIYVLGGVHKPGLYKLSGGTTLKGAIELAGGYEESGDPRRVRLEREKVASIVYDLLTETQDIALKAGDRIVVEMQPMKKYLTVTGSVEHPGAVEYRSGMTITQAIADAGGIKNNLTAQRAAIYSANSESKKPAVVELEKIMRGFQGDISLQPGDRVEVMKDGKRNPAGVTIFVAVAVGLLLLFGR